MAVSKRDSLPRVTRLRNDAIFGREKKKSENGGAIFTFLSLYPRQPRHSERSEESHHCALRIEHCA